MVRYFHAKSIYCSSIIPAVFNEFSDANSSIQPNSTLYWLSIPPGPINIRPRHKYLENIAFIFKRFWRSFFVLDNSQHQISTKKPALSELIQQGVSQATNIYTIYIAFHRLKKSKIVQDEACLQRYSSYSCENNPRKMVNQNIT